MAILKNLSSGEQTVLRARHVVGRNRADVHLYIGDTDISRHHAYLSWQDQTWLLRDVSTNGVWLNQKRINLAQAVEVNPEDQIRFGQQAHNAWVVMDAAAPQSALLPLAQDRLGIVLGPYNALPAEQPVLEIIHQGANQWLLHQGGQTTELVDGQSIQIAGETWQLHLVPDGANDRATQKMPLMDMGCVQLQFRVSHDEEHVSLHVQMDNGHQMDCGERTHHYLLLILARQRYQDWQQGFDPAAQGWLEMETLCQMLGMEASHINIQIHRARKQFSDLLSATACTGDLIERRVGSLRLSARRLQIYRGSQLEAELD